LQASKREGYLEKIIIDSRTKYLDEEKKIHQIDIHILKIFICLTKEKQQKQTLPRTWFRATS
jgi:hypothetical protein